MPRRRACAKRSEVRHALIDLNGDGADDALVFLTDPDWCAAAGCTLLVFRGSKSGYALISDSRAVETPIRVTAEARRLEDADRVCQGPRRRGDAFRRQALSGRSFGVPMAGAAQRRRAMAAIE